MSASYSPEFITLCRSQLMLVANSLSADLGVIYLAREVPVGQEPHLEPLVFYPETPANRLLVNSQPWLEPLTSKSLPADNTYLRLSQSESIGQDRSAIPLRQATQKFFQPLTSEGAILGLLMTMRLNRPWNKRERSQIEQVGQTITLALVIDRERQWAEQSLQEQQQWRTRQQELLHNLLHQLRNPLTAIYTFGKLLLKRLPGEDANRQVASNILRESEHLKELLQQLDSSLEPSATPVLSGQSSPLSLLPSSSLELHPCALPAILEPILANAAEIAQEKQLFFQTYIPPQLPLAMASSGALREVLGNLIDNALKYTPSGGIEVQVQPLPHQLSIAISDTGLGIAAADLPNLFQRSYRGAQAQGQIPGTGLGLSIAKELVEQMGGTIEVSSPIDQNPQTPGTKFTVLLPLAAALS
jgi:signal transduction histidine kinase